ncbi:MAG: hypothetical protein KA105_01600 [Caulobacter sp.]|nr:hypothetical protein [Caulobacter sp.]
MRRVIAALAMAGGLFETFKSVCLANPHDAEAAVATALAAGFTPFEPDLPTKPGRRHFEKTEGERRFSVIISSARAPADEEGPARASVTCGATIDGRDLVALAEARAWVAVPPVEEMGGLSFFMFLAQDGKHLSVDGVADADAEAAADKAIRDGSLRVLRLQDSDIITGIILDSARAL